MQTSIYFIRHGEVNNPEKIIYGRLPNFGLTRRGEKQAEEAADFFNDKDIHAIYSSPLDRAKQTAEIIMKKLEIPVIHFSDQLIEVKSSYQGTKSSELDFLQSEVYLQPLDPTDETVEQIATRMMHFLNKITKVHNGKHIVAVSHGDPIMALKAAIKTGNFEFYAFKTDHYIQHAEVYKVSVEKNKLTIKEVFKPAV